MKRRVYISLIFAAVAVTFVFPFCGLPFIQQSEENKITLIWNKSYEGQTQRDIRIGMIWTLSWLGAELPKGSFDRACTWIDSTRVTINLDSVGFNEQAKMVLREICDSIRSSEEYRLNDGIDVGQFSMLTVGSSWHYYEITGVPKTLNEFRKRYNIYLGNAYQFGVTNSSISEGHRTIYFSRDTALFHCGFLAEEGRGSLTRSEFIPEIYECFDIMPNGQLRFMIYNSEGDLISGTPSHVGDAGKPAKCLWCHETIIQTLFIENTPVDGMLTNEEFLELRDSMQVRLERYRATLSTDMNWNVQPDHTKGELLYITYMEPTLLHMTNEWDLPEGQVRIRLQYTQAEKFREFDYIGDVYRRREVNQLDSVAQLEVPESARETKREVNYLK